MCTNVVEYISIDSADNRSFSLLSKNFYFSNLVGCCFLLLCFPSCYRCNMWLLFIFLFFSLYQSLHCAHSDKFKMGLSTIAFWFKLLYCTFLSLFMPFYTIHIVQLLRGFYFSIHYGVCVFFAPGMCRVPIANFVIALSFNEHKPANAQKCQLSLWVVHFHYCNRSEPF